MSESANFTICYRKKQNKLMSFFNALQSCDVMAVLMCQFLLTKNFGITLSKESADPLGYRLVDPQLL